MSNPVVSLLPLLIVYLILAIFMTPIAKRKGQKAAVNFLACLIPILNFFWIIYICSLSDKKVIEDLEEIKKSIVSRA